MRASEFLVESIDPESAYHIFKHGFKNGAWRAYAHDDDNKQIQIVIIPAGIGDCYVEFRRDGRVDITGGGDAYSILATVISAFKLFLDENPAPEKIIFTADEQSRQKLYRRLIKKFAPEFGYEIDRDHGYVVQLKRKEEEKQKDDDREALTEAATSTLFHYVNAATAADILRKGYFDMENAVGNTAEEEYIPTTGEQTKIEKQAAYIISKIISGLTTQAYMTIVDNLKSGTEEQKDSIRYSLKTQGMLPSEIQKLERMLSTKPRQFLPYFFATTRSRLGDYHRNPTKNAVLFTLDGNELNRKNFVVKPIDYWAGSWRGVQDRGRESEDRVYGKKPRLPIEGLVKSIDMYLGHDLKGIHDAEYDARRDSEARKIIKLAQEQGIPIHFYKTVKGWKSRAPNDKVDLDTVLQQLLPEPEPAKEYNSRLDKHLEAWWELISKAKTADLSKDAQDIRYNYILYPYSTRDATDQLRNSLHNARPGSVDYELATRLVDWMVKKDLKGTGELHKWLKDKWQRIVDQEKNRT